MKESPPYRNLVYTVNGAIANIQLNRPARMNSFNLAMHKELAVVLELVRCNKKLRCLVITGNGKAFCSGQDLGERYELLNSGSEFNLGTSLQQHYNPLIETLVSLPIPVISAVNGIAAGAGASLALACDITFAAQSAKFVFAFANLGLVPDSGGSWSLVHSIGLARAKALVLLGETVTACEAQNMGMIWRCVDDGQLQHQVHLLCQKLVANPALGQSLCKRVLNQATNNTLEAQLKCEAEHQAIAGCDDDYREAVSAFMEKRPASFSGC